MNVPNNKEVIYIDIDDEITAIIEKVQASEQKIVALVLPKRANAFQSIVNMKLLKRSTTAAGKHLVLITSEQSLLPLAANVGLYVAKSLQSRPEVPTVPGQLPVVEEDAEAALQMADEVAAASEPKLDPKKPIGAYTGGTSKDAARANVAAAYPKKPTEEDAIQLDNTTPTAALAGKLAGKKPLGGAGKKFSIPNFEKFRIWFIAGGVGLVVLVFCLYMALAVMPRATVVVKTDSEAVEISEDITLATATTKLEAKEGIIPATAQQTQKVATQQADATGTKDKGEKASGEVTLKNCGASEVTIPAGTAVSAGGLTFITQQTLNLDDGKFGGVCKPSGEHIGSVDVVAQQAGDKYNLEPRADYTVAGQQPTVTANGSKMSGGVSNIVKVVAQADIDNAKQKISSQDTTAVKADLQKALLAKNLTAIAETFNAKSDEVTASAKVGDEVASITVTQKTTYSMLGVAKNDLKAYVKEQVHKQIDESRQKMLDDGVDAAVFKLQNQQEGGALVTFSATAVAGSALDTEKLKSQVAGKKANDAKEIIKSNPSVTDVTVQYSPFWVSSIPKKTSKITLTVQKPTLKNVKP